MPRPLNRITFHASANETANGNSATFEVSEDGPGAFYLDVTAFGGTSPTLDVVIEELDLVSNTWFQLAAFAQKTGVAAERVVVNDVPGSRLRARWTIGGTAGPNFTFSIGGIIKDRG